MRSFLTCTLRQVQLLAAWSDMNCAPAKTLGPLVVKPVEALMPFCFLCLCPV
jgi:hypothetical protein